LIGRDNDMQYDVEIGSRLRKVIVTRTGDGFAVEVDGHRWFVDAARLDAHRMSLLAREVSPERHTGSAFNVSCDVAISSDPASAQLIVHVGTMPFAVTVNGWRRRHDVGAGGAAQADVRGNARRDAHLDASGDTRPQRILAPMPGKVVRVLVHAGDAVRARQPLVVVEAMKMENELRAGRDGHVAAVHVQEGASVEAGALVVVIE
jgi:acetyl/propionyl-CoA carboxylase alpha subunit